MFNRRSFLYAGMGGLAGATAYPSCALAQSVREMRLVSISRRLAAENAGRIEKADFVGLVDYALSSVRPRFHLVDLAADRVSSFLVAHGRGSDPGHTGWLQRFSNEIGSKASSRGSYRTGEFYEGKYGRSMRLAGLDADNSNAEARAIVIHPAWYVGEDMLSKYGKLGRSEGCFALSPAGLDAVFARLGPGRLLYAGKF